MTEMVAFIAGCFLGVMVAVFVLGLCIAAKRGDGGLP